MWIILWREVTVITRKSGEAEDSSHFLKEHSKDSEIWSGEGKVF